MATYNERPKYTMYLRLDKNLILWDNINLLLYWRISREKEGGKTCISLKSLNQNRQAAWVSFKLFISYIYIKAIPDIITISGFFLTKMKKPDTRRYLAMLSSTKTLYTYIKTSGAPARGTLPLLVAALPLRQGSHASFLHLRLQDPPL
jgi:hypothetical protein